MINENMNRLAHSLNFIRQQVADVPDEEMLVQPKDAPNHAAWMLGHVVLSLQAMAVDCFILSKHEPR